MKRDKPDHNHVVYYAGFFVFPSGSTGWAWAGYVDYARHHPTAARNLSRLLGYKVQQGTGEEYRRVGRELVQFVALQPLSSIKSGE